MSASGTAESSINDLLTTAMILLVVFGMIFVVAGGTNFSSGNFMLGITFCLAAGCIMFLKAIVNRFL